MNEQDRIEKYLFLMKLDFSKMMKAYFRMRSYESKLTNMNLNEEQSKKLREQQEYIEDGMLRYTSLDRSLKNPLMESYLEILQSSSSDSRDLIGIIRKTIQYRQNNKAYSDLLLQINKDFPKQTLFLLKDNIDKMNAKWTIYNEYPNLKFLKEI